MKKTVVFVMFFTLLSKGIGFCRDIILASYYGASAISDAFFISVIIPSTIFGFIGTGIYLAYIPLYSQIETKYGVREGDRFTNILINALLVCCTVIIILGSLFTEPIVKLFASGFEGETLELTIKFTRITLISLYFSALISIFMGYLQLKEKHIIPSLMGLPLNIILILSIMISSTTYIFILPIGNVIAIFCQLLFLLFFVRKQGFAYKFIIDFKNNYMKKISIVALPVILGSSVEQISKLVDATVASTITSGAISALNYANQLNLFVQGIFVSSIAVVFYPMISRLAANKNLVELRSSLNQTIVVVLVLLLPIMTGTIIFAEPIVSFLFGRGEFTSSDIFMTATALFFYSFGMIWFGMNEVLIKVFFSLQNTKTPMVVAGVSVAINIVLNLILSKFLGVGGIALATSISAFVSTVLLVVTLRKRVDLFDEKAMLFSIVKVVLITILMGAIVKGLYYMFGKIWYMSLSLVISIVIGAIVYIVLLLFMKIKEVDTFTIEIRGKMKNLHKYKEI